MNWLQEAGVVAGAILVVAVPVLVPIVRWAAKAGVERAVEMKFREWEVRFSMLHERRIEVMEGIQDRLTNLRRALNAASGMQPLNDPKGLKPLDESTRALDEVERYVSTRRYYLPSPTGDRIEALLTQIREAWGNMVTGVGTSDVPGNQDVSLAMRREGHRIVREELPPLIAEVEEEFRRLARGDTED